MSLMMHHRYQLVFPDGLVQDLETGLAVEVGELISSEQIGITPEPSGKWIVREIVDVDPGSYPHIRNYFIEKF